MENSFHSRGSKNFVLKSDYLNSSRHGSKKNLSSFVDPNLNNQNQKSLFKAGSFFDQEDDDFRKDRIHMSDKELNGNIFNKPIFYDKRIIFGIEIRIIIIIVILYKIIFAKMLKIIWSFLIINLII